MGMGKNLIIFCFFFSFVLWLFSGGAIKTPALELVTCMGDSGNQMNLSSSSTPVGTAGCSISITIPVFGWVINSMYSALFLIMTLLTGTAMISIFTGRFPDPWTYFAGAGLFLIAFITFPITLINQSGPFMPVEIRLLIGGLFVIAYVLSFFEFYKGGVL